jgi:opacity protein-like surface antigen
MQKNSVFLVCFLLLFSASTAIAQLDIGLVNGVNLAQLTGEFSRNKPNLDFSQRIGLGLGGVLDLGVTKHVSLRLTPMYLQKGAKTDGIDVTKVSSGEVDSTGIARIRAAYFELPIFLKATAKTGPLQPYVMAGPNFSLILNSKLKFVDQETSQENEANADDIIKSVDIGLGFGAGVNVPLGRYHLFVESRFVYGLYNIIEEGKAADSNIEIVVEPGAEIKHRGIQILAGITYAFAGQ